MRIYPNSFEKKKKYFILLSKIGAIPFLLQILQDSMKNPYDSANIK